MNRLLKWIRKRRALKEFAETIQGQQSCLMDPMNGCPEDFAEDFARFNGKDVAKLWKLGATDEEIMRAEATGCMKARENWQRFLDGHVTLRWKARRFLRRLTQGWCRE
jgi:hypothetical protein